MARPIDLQILDRVAKVFREEPKRWLQEGWAEDREGLPLDFDEAIREPRRVVRACAETQIWLSARELLGSGPAAEKLAQTAANRLLGLLRVSDIPTLNDNAKDLDELLAFLDRARAA